MVFTEGPLRDQFSSFVRGSPLQQLPDLALFRARLRFIPIVETAIEGRHKDIKMEGKLKQHMNASQVSLKLRGKEIEQAIEEDTSFLHRLARVCSGLQRVQYIQWNSQQASRHFLQHGKCQAPVKPSS